MWEGTITSTDGSPLAGKVELWHADADGFYSQFAPGIPEWNLRASFSTGPDGKFKITTIRPAPYQIPTDGSCGKLISAAGWHAWRPAHLHVKVSAPGHELLTAQLYFPGDPHNEDDIATAVKPELMLDPIPQPEGGEKIIYNFVLDHPPRSRPGDSGRDRGPGEGLLTRAATSREMAPHLAHRRRVLELLDLRRRVERRAARCALGVAAVPLHGHPRDPAGDTPLRNQGLALRVPSKFG